MPAILLYDGAGAAFLVPFEVELLRLADLLAGLLDTLLDPVDETLFFFKAGFPPAAFFSTTGSTAGSG